MFVVEVDVTPLEELSESLIRSLLVNEPGNIAFVTDGVVGIPVPEMSESFNSDKVGLGEV